MGTFPLLLSLLAGLSTGVGGVLAVLFKPTPRLLAGCEGFAAGVMLTISLADLVPGAAAFYGGILAPWQCGILLVLLLLGGILAAVFLGRALPDETALARRFGTGPRTAVMRTALVTAAALLLHNLPEGVLTLFSAVADPAMGLRTALAVALHNIPEGIAVALPFAYATGSRSKAAGAALVSGLAEPFAALAAWIVLRGAFSPGFLNGSVVLTAGIMLWVTLDQLLPQAYGSGEKKAGTIGIVAGCLLMLLGIAVLP